MGDKPPEVPCMQNFVDYLDKVSCITIDDLRVAKMQGEKWTMLTCYDSITAKIFDNAKIPCLLVGNSAARTVFGHDSSIELTVDELIPLVRAVSSSCKRALVVAELPFGSYEESPQVALRTAARFMKEGGADAVKLVGGQKFEEHVKLLTQASIPVVAHFKCETKLSDAAKRKRDIDDMFWNAIYLKRAGAFAILLEQFPTRTASALSNYSISVDGVQVVIDIPIIGMGSGPDCDGQLLNWQDMIGLCAPNKSNRREKQGDGVPIEQATTSGSYRLVSVPKFVKKYANVGAMIHNAAIAFKDDVKNGAFPGKEHCYE